MELIHKGSLQLWRDDYMQRFSRYLEERGVERGVICIAAEILPLIVEGRKDIYFGIDAKKHVIITISPVLNIYVDISPLFCNLMYDNNLISQVSLERFSRDVFLIDLVQAYQIASDKQAD